MTNGSVDIPLHHLTVEEQRRVGIAFAVEGRMERTEAQFRLCHDARTRVGAVVEQRVELSNIQHCDCRRQLAVDDDVVAVRRGITPMRAVRDRHIRRVGRTVPAVENRDPVMLGVVTVA